MDIREWRTTHSSRKFAYYNKVKIIQKSLKYNSDPNAIIIHHLRDTEEQRRYNDEHYELWGFEIDENGNEHFEYGKYVIFVTREEHSNIHKVSDETRNKISVALNKYWTPQHRLDWSIKVSGKGNSFYGRHHSDETIAKISGEHNGMYGKHHTDEARRIISEANKNKLVSQETRDKLSKAVSGEKNGMYGKKPKPGQWDRSVELQKLASIAYKEHKNSGGTMKWQDFRRQFFIDNR
jgi:hypothetical protein